MMVDLVGVLAAAPKDEDVVAGPIGFVIFIGLCLAVAVLGWSLNKHLKKAGRAADEGVYGDPVRTESTESAAESTETTETAETTQTTETTASTPSTPSAPGSEREATTGEE